MNIQSSPLICRILDILLPKDLHHLVGDLEEEFHQVKNYRGSFRAHLYLWRQFLLTLPFFLFESIKWNLIMIKNYLKITWRNIRKHKSFSLIKILGLSISMAVCLLIILFIYEQKSYDRFHEYADRIYRVTSNLKSSHNNTAEYYATSPASLPDLIRKQVPSVGKTLHLRSTFHEDVRFDNKEVSLDGIYTEPAFFELFSFDLLQGNPKTALNEPDNIILTLESARKIFGEADPMGKVIHEIGGQSYTVAGIIEKRKRTHIRFDALISYSTLTANPKKLEDLQNWKRSIYNSYTYLLLNEDTDPNRVEAQINSLISSHFEQEGDEMFIRNFDLQALTGINFGPIFSNEIGIVFPAIIGWFLAGFALIIILIACFNYVSLTVSRAIKRSKEVGVRKVMGAYRSNVLKQFLIESVLISLIALVFASAILRWLLPEFNSLMMINFTESQIPVDFWSNYTVYAIFILFSIFVGISAGLYPALYLSSFNPARVLKGTTGIRKISGQAIRKILIVTQFSFSILFIITSLILARQFDHMVNTDYGFNREGIINVTLQDVPYERFRNKMKSYPEVEQISAISHIPAVGQTWGVWLNSDSISEKLRGHSFYVDEHFIRTAGLNLIAGRNFNPARASDTTSAVIISNETARQMQLGSPNTALGKTITVDEEEKQVIGIIDNFVSASPLEKGNPIILMNDPDRFHYAVIKVDSGHLSSFTSTLEQIWTKMGSLHMLKYKYLDQQLRESPMITIFVDFLKIIGLVTVFSVFISCLGLLGMALYSAENRVKEIGIRKVLGATAQDIVYLLSREYMVLIGIAIFIGTPLAWFVNRLWLQAVSNKAEFGIWVFLAGIFGTVLLTLITVGSQGLRAARANSINNLRSE